MSDILTASLRILHPLGPHVRFSRDTFTESEMEEALEVGRGFPPGWRLAPDARRDGAFWPLDPPTHALLEPFGADRYVVRAQGGSWSEVRYLVEQHYREAERMDRATAGRRMLECKEKVLNQSEAVKLALRWSRREPLDWVEREAEGDDFVLERDGQVLVSLHGVTLTDAQVGVLIERIVKLLNQREHTPAIYTGRRL